MPLHHPNRSEGPMKACACRWSVTGILLSLKGGVINPMRNWEFESCRESEIGEVRVANKRVARLRTLESSGRSVEDFGREVQRLGRNIAG